MLAQGMTAQWVADAAAQAGVPLVRFSGPGVGGGLDIIDPLLERPDVVVLTEAGPARILKQQFPDAHFLHLPADASVAAHGALASVIKVRQTAHVSAWFTPPLPCWPGHVGVASGETKSDRQR